MSILSHPEGQQIKQILSECSVSTKLACKVFYPGRFRLPFSMCHDQVFEILDDDTCQFAVIASWRGFGKSSIMQLGYPTKRAIFGDSRFMVPTSATFKQSMMHSENLKRQLENNLRLAKLGFRNLKSDVWSRDLWDIRTVDGHGCRVMPVSYGQEVRGVLFKDSRPDLFIIDDYETQESVMSDELRPKRKARFYSDILGAIDRSSTNYRFIVIGTVLHEDSLLMNLLDDTSDRWRKLRLELCDSEFVSNWPEQQSNESVWEMYQLYKAQGQTDSFFREYRNICMNPENAPFQKEDFRYYYADQLRNRFLEYFVLVDPAKTSTENACDTAIIGVGVDIMDGSVYIIDMVAKRLHVNEQIDAALTMAKSLGARVVGVEITGSNEYIEWPWKNEILNRGQQVEFVPLKATAGPSQYIPKGSSQHGKDSRISNALVPLYRGHKVFHPKDHPLLEKFELQLLHFPYSGRKDLIDAFSYIAGMMHKGDRYLADRNSLASGYAAAAAKHLPGNLDFHSEQIALRKLISADVPQEMDWQV
jgi:hypothetical protein